MKALTKEEILREIERDCEAVIFNVNLDEERHKLAPDLYDEIEDYRFMDRQHMYRAKELIEELRKLL